MTWHYVLYFISIIVTTAIMGFIAWYSRRNRETVPSAGVYIWIALLVSLLSLFQGLSMLGPIEEWALFWFNIRIACFAAIPVLWLIFVLHFIRKPGLLSKPRIGLLFVVPVITQIMLWTNDWHGLWVVREVVFNRAGLFFVPLTSARVMGPWYVVHILYTNALMLVGIIILFVMSIRMRRRDRGQVFILGAGTLVMVFGALIPSLNLVPGMTMNLIPQSFALGSLVIAWGLYRHRFLGETPQYDEEKRIPRKLVFLFVLLTGGILMTGFAYYRLYEKHHRDEIENQLSAIADLKVGEIVQWRKERLGDANIFHQNAAFAAMVRRYYANPTDANARWQIQRWMSKYLVYGDYLRVYLTDARGVIMMSAPEGSPPLVIPHLVRDAAAVLSSGQLDFQDLHRDTPGGPIHMAIMVPVIDEQDGRLPLGLIVFRVDPAAYLYPMLNRWPTPSKTAETLLVRRDGDNALFLNELKYQKNTALSMRVPLKNDIVAAVMAVKGREGIVEGIDYRGIPVVAALRAVPDSPWFMVARIDSAEVYAPVRERFWVMVVVVLLLVAGAGTGIGLLWRQQSDRFYRDQYESAEALRQSEEKFSLAFRSSPYAITITRPEDGRFVDVNEAFTAITGYTRDEALTGSSIGLDLWADAGDREDVVKELAAGRSVAGREYRFRSKDGSTVIGLLSAAVLQLKNERVILSNINDITDRKRAEVAMRASEVRYRRLFEAAKDGILILDAETGMIVDVNPFLIEMLGFSHEQFLGKTIWDIGFFKDIIPNKDKFLELQEKKYVRYEDLPLETSDGRSIDVEFVSNLYEIGHGKVIQCNIRDITERLLMQKSLAEISSHQKSLLSAIPDIVMEVDMNKVYTWVNGPGIEFFGNDVIGREAAFYFEGEQDTYQSVQPIFNGDENVIYLESWQRRRDGEKRLLAWWCSVLKNEKGELIGALSSACDITERKRAEELLRASEVRYRRLFEAAKDGIIILDAGTGMIVDVNPFLTEMMGFSHKQFMGKTIWDIGFFKDIIENKDKFLELQEVEYVRYEDLPLETADGRKINVEFVSNVYEIDHKKVIQCNIRDITERKHTEKELLIKNQVFEDSLGAQSVADIGGTITHVNPAFLRVWGYATKELAIGNSVGSFFSDPADAKAVLAALADHDAWDGQFRAKRADGVIFISHGYATTMRDSGGAVIGYQSTNLDVTAQIDAENQVKRYALELERSNVDLQQFAYVASHDLQEPLRMILSYLQLIEKRYRDRLDQDANDFINYAVDGAIRLQALISGLLEFSRIRTRGKPFTSVNVNDVLDGTRKDLEVQIKESGATVNCGTMPVIQADEVQIARLFQNLVQNAIKFRREGTPSLIDITADTRNGEYVFCVRDNGIGIEEKYLERIFVIFQRLHSREEYPGTGIGLSICKRIVERHGGKMWVESRFGEGSAFYFSIPAA